MCWIRCWVWRRKSDPAAVLTVRIGAESFRAQPPSRHSTTANNEAPTMTVTRRTTLQRSGAAETSAAAAPTARWAALSDFDEQNYFLKKRENLKHFLQFRPLWVLLFFYSFCRYVFKSNNRSRPVLPPSGRRRNCVLKTGEFTIQFDHFLLFSFRNCSSLVAVQHDFSFYSKFRFYLLNYFC